MKGKWAHLLSLVPLVLGALFPALVKWNHHRFQAGELGAREAIGLELLLFVFLLGIWLASVAGVFVFATQRDWLGVIWMILSSVASVGLFVWGISLGAAMLSAT